MKKERYVFVEYKDSSSKLWIYKDDFFEEYTITSRKNLQIKLKFLKTALSELYYNIISEDQFKELLNIV